MSISVEEARKLAAQFNGLPYEPGTRYSNSETYDQATGEVVHGWQVFEQIRPDGTRTGRRSFVSNSGMLCSVDIASAMRLVALREAAPDVLDALKALLWAVRSNNEDGSHKTADQIFAEAGHQAMQAIQKAEGVQA